jgi:hypothetical protein
MSIFLRASVYILTLLANYDLIVKILLGFLAKIRLVICFSFIVNLFASVCVVFVIVPMAADLKRNYKHRIVKLNDHCRLLGYNVLLVMRRRFGDVCYLNL